MIARGGWRLSNWNVKIKLLGVSFPFFSFILLAVFLLFFFSLFPWKSFVCCLIGIEFLYFFVFFSSCWCWVGNLPVSSVTFFIFPITYLLINSTLFIFSSLLSSFYYFFCPFSSLLSATISARYQISIFLPKIPNLFILTPFHLFLFSWEPSSPPWIQTVIFRFMKVILLWGNWAHGCIDRVSVQRGLAWLNTKFLYACRLAERSPGLYAYYAICHDCVEFYLS